MKILNTESLVKTVDNFNEAIFSGRDWIGEVDNLVDWISGQLGKRGGYHGSFALTESDWSRDFRLFTGEQISTNAGRAHVPGEEINCLLKLIEQETGSAIDAWDCCGVCWVDGQKHFRHSY